MSEPTTPLYVRVPNGIKREIDVLADSELSEFDTKCAVAAAALERGMRNN